MGQRLAKEINQIEDLLEYLELMASVTPDLDYWSTMSSLDNTRAFLKSQNKFESSHKILGLRNLLEKEMIPLKSRYPPKLSIRRIAQKFAELKENEAILSTGVTFGFLYELMDVTNLKCYEDLPFHFRLSIGPLKGGGGIEEEFLLKDAFTLLRKAEINYELLEAASVAFKTNGQPKISIHGYVTDVKYDVANYSRQSVLTFFSFIECFVNSIAFDYLYRNESMLSTEQILALKGQKRNGGYMNLKNRIEAMQMLIREDGRICINLTDERQRPEPFRSFFDQFEALRNASVHYSPIKQRIWLGPKDWIANAREFCDITLNVGKLIWKACYPNSEGPMYMGKLNKQKQLDLANGRLTAAPSLSDLINLSREQFLYRDLKHKD